MNENGVIFLFGKVMEDLNIYVEEIKPGFPDCVGRRFTGKGWERVSIEFEFKSSNFNTHKHDHKECDIIICWEHDWKDCPIEVIDLKEVIKTLPNEPIESPDTKTKEKYSMEEHFKKYGSKVKGLYDLLFNGVKNFDEEIWTKPMQTGATFYSPEKVFIYADFQRQGLRLTVFTRGQKIKGVKNLGYADGGGAKWGRIHFKEKADLEKVLNAVKESFDLLKAAIKKNEPTGWYAEVEKAE